MKSPIKHRAPGFDRIKPHTPGIERISETLEEMDRKHIEGTPIPLIMHCPDCHARHIDEGVWATRRHHTHSCQSCGFTWRPAVVNTVGVQHLPGFKNGDA